MGVKQLNNFLKALVTIQIIISILIIGTSYLLTTYIVLRPFLFFGLLGMLIILTISEAAIASLYYSFVKTFKVALFDIRDHIEVSFEASIKLPEIASIASLRSNPTLHSNGSHYYYYYIQDLINSSITNHYHGDLYEFYCIIDRSLKGKEEITLMKQAFEKSYHVSWNVIGSYTDDDYKKLKERILACAKNIKDNSMPYIKDAKKILQALNNFCTKPSIDTLTKPPFSNKLSDAYEFLFSAENKFKMTLKEHYLPELIKVISAELGNGWGRLIEQTINEIEHVVPFSIRDRLFQSVSEEARYLETSSQAVLKLIDGFLRGRNGPHLTMLEYSLLQYGTLPVNVEDSAIRIDSLVSYLELLKNPYKKLIQIAETAWLDEFLTELFVKIKEWVELTKSSIVNVEINYNKALKLESHASKALIIYDTIKDSLNTRIIVYSVIDIKHNKNVMQKPFLKELRAYNDLVKNFYQEDFDFNKFYRPIKEFLDAWYRNN